MSYRDEWVKAKKTLEALKVDTKKIFKQDLGPSLDAYEAANKKYEAVRSGTNFEAVIAASKARKTAAEAAYKICGVYLNDFKFFKKGVTDANVKKALDSAETVLAMKITDPLKKAVDAPIPKLAAPKAAGK